MTTTVGNLRMDKESHRCFYNDPQGTPVQMELTPIEWRIVALLVESQGRMVSYEELIREAWGENLSEIGMRRLSHWHICNLRRLIQRISGQEDTPIQTVRSFGYRWDVTT